MRYLCLILTIRRKLSDRALGYGIYGETVDGDDPIAMYKAMKEARERALNGEGATLIEAITSYDATFFR